MDVHALRLAHRTIIGSAVLEVADQLLFLGVDGDHGLLLRLRRHDFRVDVFELGVVVGMFGAFLPLAIGLAREPELHQLLAHRIGADRMSHRGQGRGELLHAFRDPDQRPHRIAQRRALDQPLERADEPRVVLVGRATPAPGPANRPRGSAAASRTAFPRLIVERASPVILDTDARPPQPAARTSPAANNRRPRSSSFEPTASHRCRIASSSIMRPTYACARITGIPAPRVAP